MRKHAYHREVLNLLKQFTAAFDDSFVYRYDKSGTAQEKIDVRYVNGPKNKVLYDITNKAKNITLPAISIEQKNIRRDASRSRNKDFFMIKKNVNENELKKIPQPIPVSFDLDISIISFYKEDIDQIASNIIAFCNPYFIISWKVPDDFGLDFIDEIRTEVSWSGEITYETPTVINKEDKYRIIGNTTFTIKSWIFPPTPTDVVKPIYVIDGNFHAVSYGYDLDDTNIVENLSANPQMETVSISAIPEITSVFYGDTLLLKDYVVSLPSDNTLSLVGKNFSLSSVAFYLSSNNPINGLEYKELSTVKSSTISAYSLSSVSILTNNLASFDLEGITVSQQTDIVLIASTFVGWTPYKNNLIIDIDN